MTAMCASRRRPDKGGLLVCHLSDGVRPPLLQLDQLQRQLQIPHRLFPAGALPLPLAGLRLRRQRKVCQGIRELRPPQPRLTARDTHSVITLGFEDEIVGLVARI